MSPDILIEQRIPPPPGQEYPYHTMFPDISRQTVEVVVDTVKTRGLWTLPQDQGFELLRSMYARFSQEYGTPVPLVIEWRIRSEPVSVVHWLSNESVRFTCLCG